jgi:hypothetical protein
MYRVPTLFVVATLLVLLISPISAQEATTSFADQNVFGVVEGFWLPDQVCELGAGWERIIFDWAEHQPAGPEDWNFLNVDERWLLAARDCNREVVAVVKHTPDWATDGTPGPGVPKGLYLPIDDRDILWANFMRRAAEWYAPLGVNRFIIWNEPDIPRDVYGFEFEGDVEDYAQLLRIAYLAAREGNPVASIHLAGTTYWHDVNAGQRLYIDRLLEHLATDPEAEANGYYFDALTLHIYFRADTVYTIVHEMRDVLERYGLGDKSIWITETNASPNLDPLWRVERPQYQITLDQQAAFLVQAAALGLAGGADYIGVYKFFDWSLPAGAESFGLIRADGSRRPAFYTWQTVIFQFDEIQSTSLAQTETANVVRLTREDGDEVLVAWAREANGAALQVEAKDAQALLLDQYGNMMQVRPVNGMYTLALPPAACSRRDGCPVGGMVTLLVQPQGEAQVIEIDEAAGAVTLAFGEG